MRRRKSDSYSRCRVEPATRPRYGRDPFVPPDSDCSRTAAAQRTVHVQRLGSSSKRPSRPRTGSPRGFTRGQRADQDPQQLESLSQSWISAQSTVTQTGGRSMRTRWPTTSSGTRRRRARMRPSVRPSRKAWTRVVGTDPGRQRSHLVRAGGEPSAHGSARRRAQAAGSLQPVNPPGQPQIQHQAESAPPALAASSAAAVGAISHRVGPPGATPGEGLGDRGFVLGSSTTFTVRISALRATTLGVRPPGYSCSIQTVPLDQSDPNWP